MRLTTICSMLMLLCGAIGTLGQEAHELTPETFSEIVYQKPALIKFYSPYCGHCQRLAPTWEAAAKTIHSQHTNIQLVSLDCTKYGEICNKFGVAGYPTIKYVRPEESDSELSEYSKAGKALTRWVYSYENGARTVLAFEQFVTDPSQWSKSQRVAYPLDLPSHPEILNVLSQEKRMSSAANDAESIKEVLPNKQISPDSVQQLVKPTVGSLGSNIVYDAFWLVVGLLVVACAYWVFLTLKVNGKLSKFL